MVEQDFHGNFHGLTLRHFLSELNSAHSGMI